jgi:septum site-determining protein MinC
MDIAVMNDNFLKSQAFKLKGRLYTFTVLQLLNADKLLFAEQLSDVIAKAPKLFNNSPIVLDCSLLIDGDVDLDALFQCIRSHSLFPVAIQGANPMLTIFAQTRGIAVLNGSSSNDKPLLEEAVPEIIPTNVEVLTTKILTSPVRSGQQVVSKGRDLIITSSVSHGAELLADGNIHVYGALRGRALAGMSGDTNARIFCQSLEAELVSIAGFYRLSDTIDPIVGACQIFLKGELLCVEPIG